MLSVLEEAWIRKIHQSLVEGGVQFIGAMCLYLYV